MALALRKKGASREATVSFLISTPETGVDSVLITYGLLGPVMAFVRPLTAVATAVAAGLLSLVTGGRRRGPDRPTRRFREPGTPLRPARTDGRPGDEEESPPGGSERTGRGVRPLCVRHDGGRAGFWMLLAFVVTGLLGALLPSDFFLRFLPWPLLSMVVMAMVGMPITSARALRRRSRRR